MKRLLLFLLSICFILSLSGCSSDGIPEVSGKINIINSDFSKYQIRYGNRIYGPDENARFVATDKSIGNFYLSNVEDLLFYRKWGGSSPNEIIGAKDNKILVHALTSRGFKQVKNFIPNSALDISPKQYKLEKDRNDIQLYVWEFDNGYLALHVLVAEGWAFYEQQVLNAVYVKNKKYLPLDNPVK